MVFHSELQPEAQVTSSPEARKTGESRALATCFADAEEHCGASEACVLRVANPMSGLAVARAGGVQEPLHCQGLPRVQGSNRWVYVRADVRAEARHLFEEGLDNLDHRSYFWVCMWTLLPGQRPPTLSSWAGTHIAPVSIRGPWGRQLLGTGIHLHTCKRG